jgi:L-asparaginase II
MPSLPPLTVEVTRGPAVESSHLVHAVVMDGAGEIKAAYGNAQRLTYPRSSLKPLQAIALVESGAADAFKFSDADIALACASHSGEEIHTTAVAALLKRIGCTEGDLECGSHPPIIAPCAPSAVLCNNCSGKHTGMLALGRFLKIPVKDYTNPTHGIQQKILGAISEMCGNSITPAVCGVDGCSAPNPAMPLEDLARGLARLMNPASFSEARQNACRRIVRAMAENPDYVAGTGRLDTMLMRAAKGKIMSKGGAEAVNVAVIPEKDTVIALKAEDGNHRASQAALAGVLKMHDLAGADVFDAIQPVAFPMLKNLRGIEVGVVRMGKTP